MYNDTKNNEELVNTAYNYCVEVQLQNINISRPASTSRAGITDLKVETNFREN